MVLRTLARKEVTVAPDRSRYAFPDQNGKLEDHSNSVHGAKWLISVLGRSNSRLKRATYLRGSERLLGPLNSTSFLGKWV